MIKLNYAMFMLEVFMPCLCLTLCHVHARNIYAMLMLEIFMPCLCLTLCLNKNIGSCCSYDYVPIMIPNLDSYLNYKFTCFDSCHLCFMTKVYVTTMQVHQFLFCIPNVILQVHTLNFPFSCM